MENGKNSIWQRVANFFNNALYVSVILTAVIFVILAVSSFLRSDWVGNWKPILDVQLIVSIWVAELPLAYFVKYILGERVDRPVLRILDGLTVRSGQSQVEPTYYGVTVQNIGDIMAEDCDILVNVTGVSEFPIPWQPKRDQPMNIRPDRKQAAEILRVVPLERTLEFPGDEGWNPPKAKLPFSPYKGVISIGATNCKPAQHEFKITLNEKETAFVKLV